MRHPSYIFATLFLAIPLLLAGCGMAEPYVYQSAEFNREREGFGKALTDRDSVSICYTKRGTTAVYVRELAEKECAAFGKKAVFQSQDFLECPFATPARATFSCVKPGNNG